MTHIGERATNMPPAPLAVTTSKSKRKSLEAAETTGVDMPPAPFAGTITERQRTTQINVLQEKPLGATNITTSKKLKTKPVLYPNGDERLRAMDDQEEHKDPESKEAKRKRRLIRNRMSAQLNRERKKAYIGQLEDQLQEKEDEVKVLQVQLAARTAESERLKRQLATCICRRKDHNSTQNQN